MTKCAHEVCNNEAVKDSPYCKDCIQLPTRECNYCNTPALASMVRLTKNDFNDGDCSCCRPGNFTFENLLAVGIVTILYTVIGVIFLFLMLTIMQIMGLPEKIPTIALFYDSHIMILPVTVIMIYILQYIWIFAISRE